METSQGKSSINLPRLLPEITEPILFKNVLCTAEGSNCWKLQDWSLQDFAEKCGDAQLPFRVGQNAYTAEPQWESNTHIEDKTMKEFLIDATHDDPSDWFYFDYKHMNKYFDDKPEIMESFNWKKFEMNFSAKDSTIWVGSKGAHTSCHQDSYGCNLVAQVHGRKMWLLFSPECPMNPTRIPYEESTIYSQYNFFSPSDVEIQAIQNMPGVVKIVTLEPGDVIFIPKGWWHYVESLETTLSVNMWLELDEDCHSRLKESLVHLVVNIIGDGVTSMVDKPQCNSLECLNFVDTSIKECKKYIEKEEPCKKKRKLNMDITDILKSLNMKYSNKVQLLPDLSSKNITDFTSKNNIVMDSVSSNDHDEPKSDEPSKLEVLDAIVNAYCTPEIVEKVSEILIKQFVKK